MESAPVAAPRPPWRRWIAAGIAVLLLGLVLRAVDFASLRALLARADLFLLALGLFAYAGSYAARALRFRLLLHSARPPLLDLGAVVALHNLLNMLLPMRSGELSYLFLARDRYGVRLAEGAASLLLARLYDVLGIGVCFAAALLSVRAGGEGHLSELGLAAAAVLLFSGAVLAGLVPALRAALALAERAAARRAPPPEHLLARLLARARSLVGEFERIRERKTAWKAFVVTEVQWLCTFATCYAILRAVGVDFSFGASVLGSTGLSIALILPINTFGNVGTFEAGWAFGYRLAGLPAPLAAETGIAAHLFIFAFAALLGLIALVLLRRSPAPPSP